MRKCTNLGSTKYAHLIGKEIREQPTTDRYVGKLVALYHLYK